VTRISSQRSIYGVHPGVQLMVDWIAGLKEKSGRTLEEWIAFAKKHGPGDEKAGRDWFQDEHGFTINPASYLAELVWGAGPHETTPEEYLKAAEIHLRDMYAGPKEDLRPLHDAILAAAAELGGDVKACPCKTIVPLFRKHVFAEIKPATRTRIDLSFALRKYDGQVPERFGPTKRPSSDRLSHKIAITQLADVDAEVKRWLRAAYELDR